LGSRPPVLINIGLSRLGKMLVFFPLSKGSDEMTTDLGGGLVSQFDYYIPYSSRCHVQPRQFSVDLSSSETVLESETYAIINHKCSGGKMEMTDPCP
jgi:hypothetical protein